MRNYKPYDKENQSIREYLIYRAQPFGLEIEVLDSFDYHENRAAFRAMYDWDIATIEEMQTGKMLTTEEEETTSGPQQD